MTRNAVKKQTKQDDYILFKLYFLLVFDKYVQCKNTYHVSVSFSLRAGRLLVFIKYSPIIIIIIIIIIMFQSAWYASSIDLNE